VDSEQSCQRINGSTQHSKGVNTNFFSDIKFVQFTHIESIYISNLNLQVYRIKNSTIWNAYKETRARIFQEMGGMTFVPEKRLFHGSPWAMNIAQQGFSLQFANAGCAYGKGRFFCLIFEILEICCVMFCLH